MTINELLAALKPALPNLPVYYDFCQCTPTTIGSYRGNYMEPALGWEATGYSGNAKAITVETLVKELEKAIHPDTFFTGWKGGDFKYDGTEELHIDNNGDATSTLIARIVLEEDYCVTIHTERED